METTPSSREAFCKELEALWKDAKAYRPLDWARLKALKRFEGVCSAPVAPTLGRLLKYVEEQSLTQPVPTTWHIIAAFLEIIFDWNKP